MNLLKAILRIPITIFIPIIVLFIFLGRFLHWLLDIELEHGTHEETMKHAFTGLLRFAKGD